jgi:hypothetical protein
MSMRDKARRIIVALFSQLSDCVLGTRKCRRFIRQVRAFRIILDPVLLCIVKKYRGIGRPLPWERMGNPGGLKR